MGSHLSITHLSKDSFTEGELRSLFRFIFLDIEITAFIHGIVKEGSPHKDFQKSGFNEDKDKFMMNLNS